ncbi:actin-binding protein [Monosporozyma servazzii]
MALEPIDYTSRSRETEQEYLKIVKGQDKDTTWLIIGPNSNKEYGPEATGNDFSEFLQAFDDTKAQYGIARVSPPGSDVYKLVLVGWCPEAASIKTRASFAANFASVANNVFKGYHIQVTARDEDDLDENELLAKVSNAAGARYSIQSVKSQPAKSQPVKSQPVKSEPVKSQSVKSQSVKSQSVNAPIVKSQDDDWDEPELEERDFDSKPLKPSQNSNYKPIGKINLQNIISEESQREDPRMFKASSPSNNNNNNNLDQKQNLPKQRVSNPNLERNYEIDSFLKDDTFKQQHNDKVIRGFHTEKSPAQLWAEKKAKQNGTANSSSFESNYNDIKKEDTNNNETKHEDVNELKSKFEQFNIESNEQSDAQTNEQSDVQTNEPKIIQPSKFIPPVIQSNEPPVAKKNSFKTMGTPLPGMHNEQPESDQDNNNNNNDDDDDWSDDEPQEEESPRRIPISLPPRNAPQSEPEEEAEPVAAPPPSLPSRNVEPEEKSEQAEFIPPPPPRRNVEPEEESEPEEDAEFIPPPPPRRNVEPEEESEPEEEAAFIPPPPPRRNVEPEEQTDEAAFIPPPPPRRNVEPEEKPEEEEEAPWAIAEYDYEAGEENELTFAENDKIINIEFVDDDWWLGELSTTGEKGLFPSNYVSLNGN